MKEFEDRQDTYANSFERLLENYSPLEVPPLTDNAPSSAAADLQHQEQIKQEPSKPGSVHEESRVTTVYDARPINAIDFTVVLSVNNTFPILPPEAGVGFQMLTAPGPADSAIVIKNFSFFANRPSIEEITATGQELAIINGSSLITTDLANKWRILFSIGINKVWQRNYSRLNLGSYVKWHPCYILAEPGSTINARFDYFDNGAVGFLQDWFVIFYGQHLFTTGRAANLEPGNIVRPPPISTPPSAISKPQNYARYTAILNTGKRLKLVNPTLQIPPYAAYKAGETSIWKRTMPALILGIKNLTGQDI